MTEHKRPEEWSLEELMAAVQEAEEERFDPGEEFLTTDEWARIWNLSRRKTRLLIHRLLKADRMELSRRMMTSIAGHQYPRPVYRILEEKKDELGNFDLGSTE